MPSAGIHCILELYGCEQELLNDLCRLDAAVRGAAEASGATVLECISHRFAPQGVTVLALLAESHISLHTWPESGYAAADVFTCGRTSDPRKACHFLVNALKPAEHVLKEVERGGMLSAAGYPGRIA